jgi:two-component system, LuxR family, sensor kinase FixL
VPPPLPAAARAVLDAAPDAIILADHQGRIVLANPQAERLFGHASADLLGASTEVLLPPWARASEAPQWRLCFEDPPRPLGPRSLIAMRSDGSEFAAEITLSALRIEGEALAMAAIRETTERRKLEEERGRLTQAHEAVRMRDEFLSIAAHELRTPLTALQLQLDGLEQALSHLEPAARIPYARVQARVDKAVRNTARLTDLVNTLLDLSRIVGGRLRLKLEETNLAAVVREVTDDFCEPTDRAPVSVDAPDHLLVVCDRFRIEQIVTNLLSNAAKYGQGRPIAVKLATEADHVDLSVRDEGIGIAVEDMERIFHKFERAAAARNYGGMGLGLYISRYLAEAHGGSIRVARNAGAGATFVLRIPQRPPAAPPPQR